jgi:DNA polymerase I-like protein with 3'-5' exonuclease and polymerase domains
LSVFSKAETIEEVVERVKGERRPRQPREEREPIVAVPVPRRRILLDNPAKLDLSGEVAIDTETTGLRYRQKARPFMVSISDEKYNTWACEWFVDPLTREVYPEDEDLRVIQEIAGSETVVKDFWNASFDMDNLGTFGITWKGEIHDVNHMARVYNTDEQNYRLKFLSAYYLSLPQDDQRELGDMVKVLRRRARQFGWAIDPEDAEADYWLGQHAHVLFPEDWEFAERVKKLCEDYCRNDTIRTIAMRQFYKKNYDEHNWHTYNNVEHPLTPIIMEMQDWGIQVDRDLCISEQKNCIKMMEVHLNKCREMVNDPEFNPASSAQLAKYLYGKDHYGLEARYQTDKGADSTNYKALTAYVDHPFVQEVLNYKMFQKGEGTFFGNYLDLMVWHEDDQVWRMHPNINPCNTRTGRFSSNDPNMMQVPSPDSSVKGAGVIQGRSIFTPRKGYTWYLLDYAGQETRIFAGASNCIPMLKAIAEGRDLNDENSDKAWGGKNNPAAIKAASIALELNSPHPSCKEVEMAWEKYGWSGEMSKMWGSGSIAGNDVADRWLSEFNYSIAKAEKSIHKTSTRSRCKMCIFAKLYGGGWKAVMELLYCTEAEAKDFMRTLEIAFPEIRTYTNQMMKEALTNGYIINKYGRKLTVDRNFAYKAVNYSIQSAAADMMKVSMINIHKYFRDTGKDAHIVLPVHDELIVEIRNDHCHHWLINGVKTIMEDHEHIVGVPMPVDVKKCRERWSIEEKYQKVG